MSPSSEDRTKGKAPTVSVRLASITEAESRVLIEELDAEFARNYAREHLHGLRPGEEMDSRLRFYLLEHRGEAVGCGAIRELGPEHAEVKRMYIRPLYRGRGYARRLLSHLEREAAARGCRILRLETAEKQIAALALYRSCGFEPIPRYGEYIGTPTSMCFEKCLK